MRTSSFHQSCVEGGGGDWTTGFSAIWQSSECMARPMETRKAVADDTGSEVIFSYSAVDAASH